METKFFVKVMQTSNQRSSTVLSLERLPQNDAIKKADLLDRIEGARASIPQEDRTSKMGLKLPQSHALNSLYDEYNRINGSVEQYVVEGKYKKGQILDAVPEGAIPIADYLREHKSL